MFRVRPFCVAYVVGLLSVASGCSRYPARIAAPDFEPKVIASAALEQLDVNGDGLLSARELERSPGLKNSLSCFDANGDGALSADEIRAELQKWLDEKTGLISIRCEVTHNGQPLKGATVRLIPEPFLGDAVPEAHGETDAMGMTQLSCDPQYLPEGLKKTRAVKPGIYRVEVTHPEIAIPEKYNSQTELGRSVSLRNSYALSLQL